MKHMKLLLMLIAITLAGSALSQEMPRHVFAAGGGNFESSAMHVSWTIGQSSPVETSSGAGIIFSPGFQQFDDQMVSVKENSIEGSFLVFPNPCTEFVQIDIELERTATIDYILYDFSGKMLLNKEIPTRATNHQEVIDLHDLAPGMYNLMLQINNGSTISQESIKLIKH